MRPGNALGRAALAFAGAALIVRPAPADDLADEADLHFRIGTERYAARDHRGALEHFLLSNRLVPNRNVVFNIARAYEQLGQYADAHRFYTQALEQEPDASRRERLVEALRRIQPFVAVLRVETSPPGATVYINRRNLGPRGTTPRTLAFPPGRYRALVELEGYEPAASEPLELRLGVEAPVVLHLRRIMGALRVEGTPGASVRVDDPEAAPLGRVPATLTLPPGHHRVFLTLEGFQSLEREVDVPERETATLSARLTPYTGGLVVNTDERDALIEVDGRPVGFTPAVVQVQAGPRRVRVSLAGYRPFDRVVEVRADAQTRLAPELRLAEEVEAASRTAEAVEDAPSSVSIVSGQELRAMGYPTLVEALRGVRGLYVSDDRLYPNVGFRGLLRAGDYGNRVLVLLNGTPTNDNWGFFSFTGFDARTDLEDVERVEVVRGPGSVLYGTGAVSGVVNVVTRGRDAPSGVTAGVSSVEDGVTRARVGATLRLGSDAGVWASVSGARSAGRDFYLPTSRYPELLQAPLPDGYDGNLRGADGFEAGTLTGRAWWGALSLQGFLHTRTKRVPTGVFGTALRDGPGASFDAPGYQSDTRALLDLRFEPRLSRAVQLLTRAVLHHYGFIGTYVYPEEQGLRPFGRERFLGTWTSLEARLAYTPLPALRVMAGFEAQVHLRADQRGETWAEGCDEAHADDCAPALYLPTTERYSPDRFDRHPFEILAGYLLADWAPRPWLRVSAGVRQDQYFFHANEDAPGRSFGATSPRLALILRPYSRGNVKLMVGRAFRAPSVYEQFYNDGCITLAPSRYRYSPANDNACSRGSGQLVPEDLWSGEVEWTHRFSTAWVGTLAGYVNYYTDLIALAETTHPDEQRPSAPDARTVGQYQNDTRAPVLTVGGEVELRREWRQGWTLAASYSFQQSHSLEPGTPFRHDVPNSPQHLASFRGAVPIVGRLLTAATRLSIEGPRLLDRASDAATDAAVVWDVVLSGREQRAGLRYAAGVYNALDWRYDVPVSGSFPLRRVPQSGRTFLLSLSLTF